MDHAQKHIRNLYKLRHMVHGSEGFDREDEVVVAKQIEQLKSGHEMSEEFTREIQKYETDCVHQAIKHMEIQLANRIKVMEHAEKSLKIEESACPDMYAYFIKKQVLLLKKLNEIKKAFNISPSTSMGRTPGSIIRQEHPNTQLPLQKQRHVAEPAPGHQPEGGVGVEEQEQEQEEQAASPPAPTVEVEPSTESSTRDVEAELLLEVLGETVDVKT